ncbi:hypothetical protein [Streptomyces sp. NPDC001657]|uniref:hypothetical protein n=1 Tax=Streptomyces sp. NPDC001657 TaxID=3154522 RepID=UPI00331C89E0
MTTAVDLNAQINHLRYLAHDFKALHDRVGDLADSFARPRSTAPAAAHPPARPAATAARAAVR